MSESERRKRMRRVEQPNHLRYLTFSCSNRRRLLGTPALRDLMIECLDLARRKHGFHLIAYVVMPEHVHLLAWPRLPSDPMHLGLGLAKQVFAQRAIARWIELEAPVISKITDEHGHKVVWQPGGGYDRNIMTDDERVEKTYYIHNNRVTRGLVKGATDWEWSSALWYSQERNRSKLSMDPACRPS